MCGNIFGPCDDHAMYEGDVSGLPRISYGEVYWPHCHDEDGGLSQWMQC